MAGVFFTFRSDREGQELITMAAEYHAPTTKGDPLGAALRF